MGTFAVKIGNAEYEVDAPDENTAWKWANATHAKPTAGQQVRSDQITQSALNPSGDMSGGQRFLAGIGKTFTDLGQGAAQAVGMGPSRQEVDERRDRDVPLMATPEGFGGSVAGGVAATVPAIAAGPSMGAAIGTGALYGGLQPVGQGESRALNAAIGGATGGAVKYGADKLAGALSTAVANRASTAAPANARAAELSRVLREGQNAGLRVPPSQANPSATNRILESIGGKAATKQAAALRNQDVAYSLAQKTAGLMPDQAITETSLSAAREAAAAPYREVAQTSPQAAHALELWRNANHEAKLNWTEHARQGTVAAYKKATEADQLAELALDEIEDIAGPVAKQALQAARIQIAKIHTVARSMAGASFDPAKLARQRGTTGDLQMLAEFTRNFPKAMERPQLQGSPGVNQLMSWLGVGTGGALGAALGGPGAAGAVLGSAATQSVPPLARALMLSGPYQRAMTQPQMQGPSNSLLLARELMNNPQVQRMLPAGAALFGTNAE